MYINLLPSSTRLKIQFRSMLRRFMWIWALGGAFALAYSGVYVWACSRAGHDLAGLEARCQSLYALQQDIDSDRQQLQLLKSHCAMLDQLQPTDHFIDLLGVVVQATKAEAGKLQIQRLSLHSERAATAAAPTKSAARGKPPAAQSLTASSTLSLNGLAEDDEVLTQFVAALRESGVFDRVELKSSSQIAAGTGTARQYQLDCRYEDLP